MFVTKRSVSRRTVLKGVGATLALPFLDAMVPAATALAKTAAQPALRFGAVFVPMGERPSHWTPQPVRASSSRRFSNRLKASANRWSSFQTWIGRRAGPMR